MDTTNKKWHNVAIYYYEEDKDQLILDGIQPLFQSLAPTVERAFFVRHWLRGPHLRLRFFATDEQFTETIKPAIEEQIGRYLREYPSTTTLDEESLRPVYQKLAKSEQEKGAILPLYPNNSIQYTPYDRRLHVLKGDFVADLIDNFYVETNDLTFRMLEHVRQNHNRLSLCLDLIFATAHKAAWPITTGFISFRSHAEGCIMRSPNPVAMRTFFEKKYATYSEALLQRLPQLLDALDHEQDTFPFILTWATLMNRYWNEGVPLIKANVLDIVPPGHEKPMEENEWWKSLLSHSTFHRRFFEHRVSRERLFANARFQGYRLVLNLLYLHLNRLGIRQLERFMLGHLAANTVEELFHVSAVELISLEAPDPSKVGSPL